MRVTRHGQLEATFSTESATWNIATDRHSIVADQWQYVEVSWHPEKGAYVHVGKRRQRSYTNATADSDARTRNRTGTVYIGPFGDTVKTAVAASTQPNLFRVLVDEMGVWFADRDHVKAFGFLEDG